jgi:hypothetical protein
MSKSTATRPRAASDGANPLVVTIAILAVIFSPMTIAGALYAAYRIAASVRPRSRELLGQATMTLGSSVLSWYLVFHEHWVMWGTQVPPGIEFSLVGLHFEGLFNLYYGVVSIDLVAVVRGLVYSGFLGVPVGRYIGVGLAWWAERCAAGAEWHPLVKRRALIDRLRQQLGVVAVSHDAAAIARCSAPPLGVYLDGDLRGFTEGPYVVVPPTAGTLGLLVAGASGSGKTVSLERMVTLHATAGRQVVFLDCKGTDPDLRGRIEAAYRKAKPDARVHQWPAVPLSIWLGDYDAQFNKLKESLAFNDPYWEAASDTALRLALEAPDLDGRGPCRSSSALLERMNPAYLKRAYAGTAKERTLTSLLRKPETLDGLNMRLAQLFASLHDDFDGITTFDQADLMVLTIPTLAIKNDAEAMVRLLLADLGQYAATRKPRHGRDVTIIIDEFSAVTTAAPIAINLSERIRDVGGQLIVSVQSWEGLGVDDGERMRMMTALAGGVLVHAMPNGKTDPPCPAMPVLPGRLSARNGPPRQGRRRTNPEPFLLPAGSERKQEATGQIDASGATALGSIRDAHHFKIPPGDVRSGLTGEAWFIAGGGYVHMQVLPNAGSV